MQSKFQRKTLIITLIIAGLLAACTAPAATPTAAPTEPTTPASAATTPVTQTATAGAYTITDPTGTTLTFDGLPQRVICLFHECIELMSGLGVEPLAVLAPNWLPNFVDDPAYFPQPNNIIKLQPEESGSWNYEEIAALQPDIVFGGDDDRTALTGITQVYSFGNTYSMNSQDTLDHLLEYGRMLGLEEAAQAAITRYQDRLAAYVAKAPRDQSVLLVAYWDEGAWIYSGASVPCSILNQVAVCDWPNPDPQPGSWGYSSTVEAVLQLDPDVIILENWTELSNADAMAQLRADPLWSEVRAVQTDRIFPMTNRDGYGLGPIGGAKLLDLYLPLIYPAVFPQALTDEEVAEILGKPATIVAPTTGTAIPLSITDGSGVTLNFDAPPQRIVCLYTRCTEILATLGLIPLALPSWIADVAAEPAYFPQPNEIVILAPTNDDVGFDLEELAALQPDLVLGWEELRPALEGIAPLHAVRNDMDSYQESHAEIRAFAQIFGREAQAETAIQAFLDRLTAYQARAPRNRSIIDLWANEGEISYRDGASGTCNLLNVVAECAWPDPTEADVWSVTTSIEGLLQLDPDVIIYDDWADAYADNAALLAGLGQDPLWQELTAFKTGQIYETPAQLYNLDGMGTVGATRMLDTLIPLVYPDLFPAPLTDEQVQEILAQQ